MTRFVAALGLAVLACLLLSSPATAVELELVADDFAEPTYVTSEPGDAGRLYVTERKGRIKLVTANGTREFADLSGVVGAGTGGEQGLHSIAFPPDFDSSGLLYAYFTDLARNIRIAELRSSGDTADPATLRTVLEIDHPGDVGNFTHYGGQLQFGPDGYLYASIGDGGGFGDPGENAQDLGELLGKMIRIDPRRNGADAYRIPGDNPFVGVAGARPEIWSSGLRNPYRFSFDRTTGDLTIGDVGEDSWEEVDFAPLAGGYGRGVNWGWDCREGAHVFEPDGCPADGFTDPVLEYPSDRGPCAAITGGYVVRDPGLTELAGRYLYTDSCLERIRSAVLGLPTAVDDRPEGLQVEIPVSFGEDACGRVYVVSYYGEISRFVDGTPTDCSAVTPPPDPPVQGECGPVVGGSQGNDSLRGGPGGQDLLGRSGDDSLRGDGGGDCINGAAGRDRLRGGEGRDRITGGPGRDRITSEGGGRDVVACGGGRDVVIADRKDRLRGCGPQR